MAGQAHHHTQRQVFIYIKLVLIGMVSLTCCTDLCTALRFSFPNLTMDNWSQYNQELKTGLGPLHFSIANDLITPAEAGDQFSQYMSDFLCSKDEFVMDENKTYIENQSKSLEKARTLKNSLRKKAFGKKLMLIGKNLNRLSKPTII